MSAIIRLRSPSDQIYKEVKEVVNDAGFIITGDSANYIAVAYDGQEEINDTEKVITMLTDPKYKGVLIPLRESLESSKKTRGRIAMAFVGKDVAEDGLSTMYFALK